MLGYVGVFFSHVFTCFHLHFGHGLLTGAQVVPENFTSLEEPPGGVQQGSGCWFKGFEWKKYGKPWVYYFEALEVRHHHGSASLKSWWILRSLGRQRIELLEANVDKHWTGPLQLAKKCLVKSSGLSLNFGMFCNRAMDFQKKVNPSSKQFLFLPFPCPDLRQPKAAWRCLEPERWQKTAGPGMPGFNHRWWKKCSPEIVFEAFL